MQPVIYMLAHATLCLLASISACLWWHSFWAHTAFIVLMMLGATWYVPHLSPACAGVSACAELSACTVLRTAHRSHCIVRCDVDAAGRTRKSNEKLCASNGLLLVYKLRAAGFTDHAHLPKKTPQHVLMQERRNLLF